MLEAYRDDSSRRRRPRPGRALLACALLFGCLPACGTQAGPEATAAGYAVRSSPEHVGRGQCVECHAAEAAAWTGSHHDLAMQAATSASVLGDFDDARVEHDGITTRFFRDADGGYFVHTQGADGAFADFRVSYVFGVEPLQQVLLETRGGRLQCLPLAWDVAKERWYDLEPDVTHSPGDALHWTGVYQNWNTMCAACHSTNLVKGYDAERDLYATTYIDVDVSCEACHGPAGTHVAWARADALAGADSERPAPPEHGGFTLGLERGDAAAQLRACGACHSRRAELAPLEDPVAAELLDRVLPERLHAGAYHADGQILGEVYVYGSFVQSKMHASGVGCTDCHDPHSLELYLPGDAVCLQCHSENAPLDRFEQLTAKRYDAPAHHFHEPDSPGASCRACHMRAQTYMGIDERRDHSFRIPRPDLTLAIGTPNACADCHAERGAEWAQSVLAERAAARSVGAPGASREAAFAPAFAAARRGSAAAQADLLGLVLDADQAAIVRATAIDLLDARSAALDQGAALPAALAAGARDDDPMVRAAALRAFGLLSPAGALEALLAGAHDPVRAVRVEAAVALAGVPAGAELSEGDRAALVDALAEYEADQEQTSDRPSGRLNLAVLRERQGRAEEALELYRGALALDRHYLPARFNLATLLNATDRNAEAIELLRTGVELHPGEGELHYSLGLALAEEGAADAAAERLARAAVLLPERPRVQFNAGLALQGAQRHAEAVGALTRAAELAPGDVEIAHARALAALELDDPVLGREALGRLLELAPGARFAQELSALAEAQFEGR